MTALSLGACGDDLESRQAAVGDLNDPREVVSSAARETAAGRAPAQTAEPAAGFSDDDTLDESFDTAEPAESLVDNAQGFSTQPLDDTSGFDPSPAEPQGFAPEPLAPEAFEE